MERRVSMAENRTLVASEDVLVAMFGVQAVGIFEINWLSFTL